MLPALPPTPPPVSAVDWNDLKLGNVVGVGDFGRVFKADYLVLLFVQMSSLIFLR